MDRKLKRMIARQLLDVIDKCPSAMIVFSSERTVVSEALAMFCNDKDEDVARLIKSVNNDRFPAIGNDAVARIALERYARQGKTAGRR